MQLNVFSTSLVHFWLAVLLFVTPRMFAQHALEGPLESHLRTAELSLQQLYSSDRFPNVTVAMDGTVLAFWNGVQVRRSTDGGVTWSEPISVGPGFMGGGVIVDESSGDILAFVESHHPPAEVTLYRSTDHGQTWSKQATEIRPNSLGHVPSMHMNDHGITLRHSAQKGRLIRATRWYAGQNDRSKWSEHYTNAMFSDDGGQTWQASEPFPAFGTGEAAIAELSDGRLYYNSRRHWAPEGENPLRRWSAISNNGGQTWTDLKFCQVLPDGDQHRSYGLMGGLVRLPVQDKDILIYSNIISPEGRRNGHVWASFDGGQTWPIQRQIFAGNFAYSSLDAGRPNTPSQGWIYLLFEGGPQGGGTMAKFNLAWILEGEKTGDGVIPDWVIR
ncbi:MAG: exo-alpha-sialidase [Planctomycetales bacterium]|nr:exo-alpha-sialidase [Planctomycetales bacterium]